MKNVPSDWRYGLLLGIFVTSLTAANYLAAKIVVLGEVAGIQLLVPAGVLAYAVTFTVTDIIGEVYGKKPATTAVLVGFVTQLLIPAYSIFASLLPTAPFQSGIEDVLNRVLGVAPNIVLASLAAYIVSQNHDVWAFHFWKKMTKGRHLWLRNNASTAISQLIDTVIFIVLAFGVLPSVIGGIGIPWELIPATIAGQYIVKLLIAFADTPFVYFGVYLLRQRPGIGEVVGERVAGGF